MENRFQRILLMLSVVSACVSSSAFAAEDNENNNDDELGRIITPDIERRHIKESDLDSEDFEVGIYYGMLSVEDFGSNAVVGATVAYHITEDFFAQLNYGTSETKKTSYELLSGGVELLTKEQRDLNYYNISLGYNLLPGQVYISDKWHFNTGVYIVAGAGNTHFADKDYFTYNLGAGFKLYANDWLMFDLSMRNYAFKHELFGVSKKTNNLESRLGVSFFF